MQPKFIWACFARESSTDIAFPFYEKTAHLQLYFVLVWLCGNVTCNREEMKFRIYCWKVIDFIVSNKDDNLPSTEIADCKITSTNIRALCKSKWTRCKNKKREYFDSCAYVCVEAVFICVLSCLQAWTFWQKPFPQSWHLNGRSPVCILMCFERAQPFAKLLWQCLHS